MEGERERGRERNQELGDQEAKRPRSQNAWVIEGREAGPRKETKGLERLRVGAGVGEMMLREPGRAHFDMLNRHPS